MFKRFYTYICYGLWIVGNLCYLVLISSKFRNAMKSVFVFLPYLIFALIFVYTIELSLKTYYNFKFLSNRYPNFFKNWATNYLQFHLFGFFSIPFPLYFEIIFPFSYGLGFPFQEEPVQNEQTKKYYNLLESQRVRYLFPILLLLVYFTGFFLLETLIGFST